MTSKLVDKSVLDTLRLVTGKIINAEQRQGQEEMAVLVGRALANNRHLIVQAGTGTGKTLGYLVPVIISGQKVVVSTVTKALQDQLAQKDLPLLAEALNPTRDQPLSWSVIKGRNNYLCRQRISELSEPKQAGLELDDASTKTKTDVDKLIAWSNTTLTGDQGDLDWQPVSSAWQMVSVGSDECPGKLKCAQGSTCFAERARDASLTADIVIVNGWLYALDIVTQGSILGPHDVVVFDEAHELEDVIAHALSIEISPRRIDSVRSKLHSVISQNKQVESDLRKSSDRLDKALANLTDKRIALPLGGELRDTLIEVRQRVSKASTDLAKAKTNNPTLKEKATRTVLMCDRLIENIDLALTHSQGYVGFTVKERDSLTLKVCPLNVGPMLSELVWSERTAVLTSATIPLNLPDRIGLPSERFDAHQVASPFDYERNSILYCAAHLPDPTVLSRDKAVHHEIEQLINAAGGRTLVLFTSYARLNAAYEELRKKIDFKIFKQDDLPKMELLRKFAEQESNCLFATQGFFHGVDIPGRTLSLVIIDRLPFPVPSDPLLTARREAFGSSAFTAIDMPIVATKLAQAAGRLIRSQTDRGVVAVLDPRLATKNYGKIIIETMPKMEFTTKLARAIEFLDYAINNR